MYKQTAVALQVYIKPDQVDSLNKLLHEGGNPLWSNSFFPLEKINSVHFARWIIAPATDKFKASVIYSANVDGTVEQHFKDLVEHLTEGLDAILSHCEGYPHADQLNNETRLRFLQQHFLKTPTFYVGAPNRTVEQIRNEEKLHVSLQHFIKENKGNWKTKKEAYAAIKDHVKNDSQWDWARKNYHLPKQRPLMMILAILLILALLPFLILAILCIHIFYEIPSKPYGKTINEIPIEDMARLQKNEDIIYQNQLSQVFETKSGLRKLMLRFLLWVTNYGAKNWFVKGELFGTPTIHFARWVFIDGGKRFVFFSNFDGTYDGYLGDFVDNNGWGLNAIYGAAVGYPRTKFMFGGGSYNFQEFLGWGRITQVSTPVWYSAYPWNSLPEVVKRTEIRVKLFQKESLNENEINELLQDI